MVCGMAGKSIQVYLNEKELGAFYQLKEYALQNGINASENHLTKCAIAELCKAVGIETTSTWASGVPVVMPHKSAAVSEQRLAHTSPELRKEMIEWRREQRRNRRRR
jgi:hypothetical protein